MLGKLATPEPTIRTTAKRDGGGWVLSGRKTFITNAVYGDLTILAARTDPDDRYGLSMFLVPRDTPGFSVSRKLDKHGWRCSDTAELVYEGQPTDVWIVAMHDHTPGFERDFLYRGMTFWTNELRLLRDGEWVKVDKPDDAKINIHREWLFLEMRTDWKVGDTTFGAGSLIVTNLEEHMAKQGTPITRIADDGVAAAAAAAAAPPPTEEPEEDSAAPATSNLDGISDEQALRIRDAVRRNKKRNRQD